MMCSILTKKKTVTGNEGRHVWLFQMGNTTELVIQLKPGKIINISVSYCQNIMSHLEKYRKS